MGQVPSMLKEAGREVKAEIQEQQFQVADVQRQNQIALQIAMTRDQIMWGGGLYSLIVLGTAGEIARTRQVPKLMMPPLVIGGFVLAYLCDMAYGDKMVRVRNEAEYIYHNERYRLIPPSYAPFARFWVKETDEFKKTHPGADKRVSF